PCSSLMKNKSSTPLPAGGFSHKVGGQAIPRHGDGGVDATSRKMSRSSSRRSGRGGSFNYRIFHDFNQPTRLRGFGRFATFLDRAATPPSKGEDFAMIIESCDKY